METIADVVAAHCAGARFSDEEREQRIAAAGCRAESPESPIEDLSAAGNKVAVIPLRGVLARHMDLMMRYSGGTSTDAFAAAVRAAASDENVTGIMLFCDTPGGTVDGAQEAAAAVREVVAAGKKPVLAYVEGECCSAGMWIASQAQRLVSAPHGIIGSLGVLLQHMDVSSADEKEGVKFTYITYPEGGNKAEANPHQPLKAETLEHLQELIKPAGDAFYAAVAEGRGVTLAKVNQWGKGRVFDASQALEMGMIDDVTNFDGALALLDELSGDDPEEETDMANIDDAAVAASVKAALPEALAATLPSTLRAELEPLLAAHAEKINLGSAAAMAPIDERLKAVEAGQVEMKASLAASNKATAETLTRQALERLADSGQLAPALVEEELADLMCLSEERRQARLDRMKTAKSVVPTNAANLPLGADPVASNAAARDFGMPNGDGPDPLEASVVARLDEEGISPADGAKYVARYNALMKETADA